MPVPMRPVAAALSAAFLVLATPGAAPGQATAPEPRADAPVTAEARAEVGPLLDALGVNELLPVMRQEGLASARKLASDMFPGRGGPRWEEMVDQIYRVERMRGIMTDEMATRLASEEIDALMQFFGSELGRRIVRLEVTAREALLDEAVEEASEAALADMRRADDPRLDVLQDFVEANELVEMNVVGALNSNWAFYQGLEAGGAFGDALTERQMLADVWGQEEAIRAETQDWVYSYLGMAYRPLSDDEIAAYTALSETPEGQALNTALFAAYDVMFVTISRDLGLAAAQFMAGEDI